MKKLEIKKIKVAKLDNLHSIKGGGETNDGTVIHEGGVPRCINKSKDFVED